MSKLIIVPTPIGNLGDVSHRTVEALKSCDVILCEDTRVCSKLLKFVGITKKLITYRDDNEQKQTSLILSLIKDGYSVCLTTDAGTPCISDPGYRIVNACRKNNITIEVLPGPCAAITALSASGMPTNGFLFVGFLPNKSSARRNFFEKYKNFEYSIIFYESCHRIQKFIEDAYLVLGRNRTICVAKEITKLHELFITGKLYEVLEKIKQTPQKGEFVIIIAPQSFQF